jgi:hypothetical protein
MLQSHESSKKPFTAANQSELPAFFSTRQVNLKICQIPEDDLPRLAKSRLTTSRNRLGPGKSGVTGKSIC